MSPLLERRGRTRFRVRLPFTLRNDGQEVRGTTRNISLLGIAAYTKNSLPAAQQVLCAIEVPHHAQPILVKGTVTRCATLPEMHPDGSFEMGVFFKEFEKGGESALLKYLDRIVKKEEAAIRAGYKAFRQKLAKRRRRRRIEALRKKERQVAKRRKAYRKRSKKTTLHG